MYRVDSAVRFATVRFASVCSVNGVDNEEKIGIHFKYSVSSWLSAVCGTVTLEGIINDTVKTVKLVYMTLI